MKIEALETLVRIWAEDRGIFEHGTPAAQFIKTREEVNELGQAILDGDEEQIKDGIGDTIVTLIIIVFEFEVPGVAPLHRARLAWRTPLP